jgi:anti-anti-sigma regulatory factor
VFCDSSACRNLVLAHKHITGHAAQLRLTTQPVAVLRVLALLGVDQLPVHLSVDLPLGGDSAA